MTARTRAALLVEEMACMLIDQVPDLGDDHECIRTLIKGFAPADIFCLLDAARDLARAARTTEADLWDKLMREPHT